MSLSPDGNKILLRSHLFPVLDSSYVGEVRRFTQEMAQALEFSEVRAERLAIVANELATNLYRHAVDGQIIVRGTRQFGETYVELIAIDRGPGISNIGQSIRDGVSTGTTPGTGLGAIRRLSDLFDIESRPSGTTIACEVHSTDESADLACRAKFRVSAICLPIASETVCGDAWHVRETPSGYEIIVADGLGHGPVAHKASTAAVDVFCGLGPKLPLDHDLKLIHDALRATRGAAVSLARVNLIADQDDAHIEFSGIGNVRSVLCEGLRDRTLITHPGTAGLSFRAYPVQSLQWPKKGAFVLHSDGLQSRWSSAEFAEVLTFHPGLLAAALFRTYNRGTDDVTIVVCNFSEGAGPWKL